MEASAVGAQKVSTNRGDNNFLWQLYVVVFILSMMAYFSCTPRYDKYTGDTLVNRNHMGVRPKRKESN